MPMPAEAAWRPLSRCRSSAPQPPDSGPSRPFAPVNIRIITDGIARGRRRGAGRFAVSLCEGRRPNCRPRAWLHSDQPNSATGPDAKGLGGQTSGPSRSAETCVTIEPVVGNPNLVQSHARAGRLDLDQRGGRMQARRAAGWFVQCLACKAMSRRHAGSTRDRSPSPAPTSFLK